MIKLSDHFSFKRLLRFTLPSIVMMVFTSVYGVVDGFFVSNYAGKTAFASLNLIYPFLMIMGSFGFMIGTGGTAIVAKTLGEGDKKKANSYFSLLVYTTIVMGIAFALLGIVFLRDISILLGADEAMIDYCVAYGRIILFALPLFMLQNVFQSFFVSAEKPQIGLGVTVGAGLTNIVLDYVLVGLLGMDIVGAALATAISQAVGGFIPLVYFALPNKSALRLGKTMMNFSVLFKTCTNGMSELLTNLSMSFVSMLYNLRLIDLAGEDGIAAYGVIMYLQFIFVSIFIGYSIGSAPIISYNYGAENHSELKGIFRKSLVLIGVTGISMVTLSLLSAMPLSKIFVGYDEKLLSLTVRGFRLFSLSFLVCGVNIFASSFFTALNDGVVSAVISFSRTVVFQVAAVLLLPLFLEVDGIWLAIGAAEVLGIAVSGVFFVTMRKKYKYA